MKRLLFLLAFAGFVNTCIAQVVFEKVYSSGVFFPHCLHPCSDGGFLIGGANYTEGVLIRTNSAGQPEWSAHFTGDDPNNPFNLVSLAECSDGYYMLGASADANGTGGLCVQKLSTNGVVQWGKFYPGTSNSYNHSKIRATNDGGFIISESTLFYMGAIRCDKNGDMLWKKNYTGDPADLPKDPSFDCLVLDDGGILFTGKRTGDICLVKTDPDGQVEWTSVFNDGGSYYHANSVIAVGTGGYLIVGFDDQEPFAMKTDEDGNIAWYHTYSGAVSFEQVCALGNGNFIVSGYDMNMLSVLVTLDPSGNVVTSDIISDATPAAALTCPPVLCATQDGGYAAACVSYQDGGVTMLLKTDVTASLSCGLTPTAVSILSSTVPATLNAPFVSTNVKLSAAPFELSPTGISLAASDFCEGVGMSSAVVPGPALSVFPSPVEINQPIQLKISGVNERVQVRIAIYDVSGKLVQESEVSSMEGSLQMETTGFTPGIYFVQLISAENELLATEKFFVK